MSKTIFHSPGEIAYDSEEMVYLDQLTKKEVYIPKNRMKHYLKTTHGITPEVYYNLVMHNDPDRVQICPGCGKKIEFNTLLYPYHQLCNNCRKNYSFRSDEDVQNYCKEMHLPLNSSNSEIEAHIKYRIKYLARSYKPTGKSSDELMSLLKANGKIKMSDVYGLVEEERLNARYTNRSNIYQFLLNNNFLHYEIQFIIINDR